MKMPVAWLVALAVVAILGCGSTREAGRAMPEPAPAPPIAAPVAPPAAPAPPKEEGPLPKINDYVYVEELPEAITKVQPEYPAGVTVEGTVLVQALVGTDGRIKDTKIVKSVESLDEAAVAAVRQWVFKPAMAAGKPVAVWVAIPVKFPPN